MNQDYFDPRSYFAPFTPLGGTYVYTSARRSLAPPRAAYIKVAPRVILSPARPRFSGWSVRQGEGSQAPLTLATRSSSPPSRPSAPKGGALICIVMAITYFSL